MKKIIVFLLSLTIAFTPSLVFANTSLGGWTITNQIAQGASTVLNASKTAIINGANILKTSTAKITPNASQVAKVLRGGAYGYAISIALQQILGKTVDWVLDPANNTIKYNDVGQIGTYMVAGVTYKDMTLAQACQAARSGYLRHDSTHCIYGTIDSSGNEYTVARWGYITVTVPESEEKTIPLNTVAERVISNAETSSNQEQKAGAQAVTTAAAEDLLANDAATQSDVETQLNTNSKTQTSEAATGTSTPSTTNPQATNIALSFPVFCGWAPLVCEAAQSAIKFPTTVTNWWNIATQSISTAYTETKNWLREEPQQDTDQLEIEQPEEFDNSIFSKDRIQVSRQCPVPQEHTMNVTGVNVSFSFDLTPLCSILEMARPALVACSYLYACYIIIGAARNG